MQFQQKKYNLPAVKIHHKIMEINSFQNIDSCMIITRRRFWSILPQMVKSMLDCTPWLFHTWSIIVVIALLWYKIICGICHFTSNYFPYWEKKEKRWNYYFHTFILAWIFFSQTRLQIRASKYPIYSDTRVRVFSGPTVTGPGPDPGPKHQCIK